MFAPVRQPLALRTSFPPGLLVSAATVSFMFTATPFLLPELGRSFGIGTASLGWFSSAQVGAFALASFGAGRFLHPSKALLLGAGGAFAVANILSIFVPGFWWLVATRALAGLAAGTVNWIAWSEAARRPAALGRVAAIGPIAATVGALSFAPLIAWSGYQAVFGVIAVIGAVALLLPVDVATGERGGRGVSSSHSNRVLLVAVGALTLFASAAFVFLGIHLEEVGAPPWVLSAAMAGNALGGIWATRLTPKHAWVWVSVIAIAAVAAFVPSIAWLTVVAVWAWGFSFWMAVPRLLRLLEERSDRPGERTGDAQGLMAVGRIIGPVMGGGLEAAGGFALLGAVAGAGVASSAAAIGGVEWFRARVARQPDGV